MNEAWELARKIYLMSTDEVKACFDISYKPNVFKEFSFEEALEKYENYEKLYTFNVGDKIYCGGNDSYGVITYKKDYELNVLWDDGSVDTFYPRDVHIDEIINTGEKVCVLGLLKEIRADEN